MSRSVSAPSSVTKTSPCWNGFIVPGSTFRYGSSFCIVTRRPRERRSRPRLLAVRPLPREEATPPVTKMCRVVDSDRPESRCARSVTGFQPTRRTPVAGEPDGVSPDTSGSEGPVRVRGIRHRDGVPRTRLRLDGADVAQRGAVTHEDGADDDESRDHRTTRRGT